MPFNMAWFKAQEEKKKKEELERKKAENPDFIQPAEDVEIKASVENENTRLL